MTVVAGLDVYAGKWVGIVLIDGVVDEGFLIGTFDEALKHIPASTIAIGVDIPIGLPELEERPADLEARRLLGRHAASVFITPPREVMHEADWQTAQHRHRELRGKGMSRQTWGMRDKILEVAALAATPPVYEVHPEVSFWAMNDKKPMGLGKHTWAGHNQRRRLLEQHGIVVPDYLAGLAGAGIDDVLDAAAAAWSANRIATSLAEALPPGSWGRGSIHY